MTFNTDKNKINKAEYKSSENQFKIDKLSTNDGIILSKTNNLNQPFAIFKNTFDFSSDWLTPEVIIADKGEATERIWKLFKEYAVEINSVNKDSLPLFDSKISYRLGDSELSLPIPDAIGSPGYPFDDQVTLSINNVIEIKSDTNNNTNVIYRTSIDLIDIYTSSLPPIMLQLKFFITLYNLFL